MGPWTRSPSRVARWPHIWLTVTALLQTGTSAHGQQVEGAWAMGRSLRAGHGRQHPSRPQGVLLDSAAAGVVILAPVK